MTKENQEQAMLVLKELTQGNPGALSFLITFITEANFHVGNEEGTKLKTALVETGLRGTQLYVLWSDICEKSLPKVIQVLQKVPPEVLREVCAKQDRSGKAIVDKYLL